MELGHLVRIDVLASQQENEWASTSFIIPKKDKGYTGSATYVK
jgi:hypothetical protein